MRGLRLLICGMSACWASSFALAQGGAISKPEPPPQAGRTAPGAAQIDRNGVLILVRSTLLALDAANHTGNYTVLRDLGAPQFQAANTAARLSEVFASHRSQNLDLSGVAVLEPQLTILPEIGQSGLMRMAGFFPSVPLQVNFDLLFAPVEGRWRVFGISVGVGHSAPSAPAQPPEDTRRPEMASDAPAPSAIPAPSTPSGHPKRSEPKSRRRQPSPGSP